MTEISTPKNDLAQQLSEYTNKEQREILRAARYLRKYINLTMDELTDDEEADKLIEEFEKENKDVKTKKRH